MKRLFAAVLLFTVLNCTAFAEDWGALTGRFSPVLEEWAAGLAAEPEAELERDAIDSARRNVWISGGQDPMEAIGYAILDLDGDGSPELVIGAVDAQQDVGSDIFEILTLENGQPVTVREGWERNRLFMTFDEESGRNGFYQEGSSGAFNSVYQYCQNGWRDVQTLEANTDFDTEKTVWTLNGQEIDEARAQALIDQWQAQKTRVGLLPFAQRDPKKDF